MKDLTINCADQPGDCLQVRVRPSMRGKNVVLGHCDLADDNHVPRVITLSEETARELFNWLGVWLHTR